MPDLPINYRLKQTFRSFTLLEVVFAVGIILLFLGSLVAILNVSSRNAVVSKHRLQAANLARGSAEIARAIRDTALTQGRNWDAMNAECWLPDGDSYPQADCNHGGHFGLKNGAEPATDHPTYEGVIFNRQINVLRNGDVRKITVTVSWDDYGQPHNVTIVTYLTNWPE